MIADYIEGWLAAVPQLAVFCDQIKIAIYRERKNMHKMACLGREAQIPIYSVLSQMNGSYKLRRVHVDNLMQVINCSHQCSWHCVCSFCINVCWYSTELFMELVFHLSEPFHDNNSFVVYQLLIGSVAVHS